MEINNSTKGLTEQSPKGMGGIKSLDLIFVQYNGDLRVYRKVHHKVGTSVGL